MWMEASCNPAWAMGAGAVLGVGLDLVRIDRAARLLEAHGETVLRRVCHQDEVDESDCVRPSPDRLATVLAAKEAVFKALGHGVVSPLDWPQVQVRGGPAAALVLTGPALGAVLERGVSHILFNCGEAAGVRFALAILWRSGYDH